MTDDEGFPVDEVTYPHLRAAVHFVRKRLEKMGALSGETDPDQLMALAFMTAEHFSGREVSELFRAYPRAKPHRGWAKVQVRKALTIGEGDHQIVIRTALGAARAMELGADDTFANLVAMLPRDVGSGETGPWTCPTCRKTYPVDYEPDICENCGTGLVRFRRASPEETRRLREEMSDG